MHRLAPVLLAVAACAAPARRVAPELRTAAADGVVLTYEAQGPRGAPAVVFVHGWACSRAHWVPTLGALRGGRRALALDLGGHGHSGSARERWTLDAFAGDVLALLEAEDLRDAVLVGHSMGGLVCLRAAALAPERVRAVIAVESLHDPDARYTEAVVGPILAQLEANHAETLAAQTRGAFAPVADPSIVRAVVEIALGTDPRVVRGVVSEYIGLDARSILAACPVPVRCLNAREGTATREEALRAAHPDLDLRLMEGVRHFPMLERPASFARALEAWIDELEGDATWNSAAPGS